MSDSPAQRSGDEAPNSRASSNSVDLPPEPEVITNDHNSSHNRPHRHSADNDDNDNDHNKEEHAGETDYDALKAVDPHHIAERELEHEREEAALEMQEEYEAKERDNMERNNNEEEEDGEKKKRLEDDNDGDNFDHDTRQRETEENVNDALKEEREDQAERGEGEGEGEREEKAHDYDKEESSSLGQRQLSLYIGLGPAARDIRIDDFRRFLESQASSPELIGDIRMRGRCAFVDIATLDEAERLIAQLHNEMYEDRCRMTVEVSRRPRSSRIGEGREMFRGNYNNNNNRGSNSSSRRPFHDGGRENRNYNNYRPSYSSSSGVRGSHEYNGDGHPSLFIGLGPNGVRIPDHVIRERLEEAVPILAFRRHGQCAFVDVEDDIAADKLIREVSNQYIDDARISVQFSRDNMKRRRNSPEYARGGTASSDSYSYRGRYNGRDHDRYHDDYNNANHDDDNYNNNNNNNRRAGLPPPAFRERGEFDSTLRRRDERDRDLYRPREERYKDEEYAATRGRRDAMAVRRNSPGYPEDKEYYPPRYSQKEEQLLLEEEEEEEASSSQYRTRKDDRNRFLSDKAYPARREAYNREHRTQEYKHRGRSLTPPRPPSSSASFRHQDEHRGSRHDKQHHHHHHRHHSARRGPRSISHSHSRSRSVSSRYSRSSRSYSSRSRSMTPPRRGNNNNNLTTKNESGTGSANANPTNISNSSNNNNNNNNKDGIRNRSYSPASRHSSMERDRGSRRAPRPAPRRV